MLNELKIIQENLQSDAFVDFYNATSSQNPHDTFVVGILSPKDMILLGANSNRVLLSRISLDEHKYRHKDMGIEDYRRLPEIIAKGEIWNRERQKKYILLLIDGMTYRAALKVTRDGSENYLTSLIAQPDEKADKEIRVKYQRIR